LIWHQDLVECNPLLPAIWPLEKWPSSVDDPLSSQWSWKASLEISGQPMDTAPWKIHKTINQSAFGSKNTILIHNGWCSMLGCWEMSKWSSFLMPVIYQSSTVNI
jgi:hypothetical protein